MSKKKGASQAASEAKAAEPRKNPKPRGEAVTPADAATAVPTVTAVAEPEPQPPPASPHEPQAPHETHAHEHAEHDQGEFREALKKSLDLKVEDAGLLRKQLTITIPTEIIQQEKDRQYGELLNDAIVPGFRKGRAPRRLVEKRFGAEVNEQVQTKLVTNSYMVATEMKDLKVLGDPLLWVKSDGENEKLVDVDAALQVMKLPTEGPFTFRCEVEVRPEFELPELRGIQVKRPRVVITDDDVSKQIDRLRGHRGTWELVEKGAVKEQDLLIVDLKMVVGDAMLKDEENVQLFARPQRLEGVALPKLGQTLAGATVGSTREIEETIADDHERADLRGKTARITVTIHEIKRFKLPPIDAEFLSAIGFENEKELRDAVRERMNSELDEAVRQGMRGQVSRYLIDGTKMELPERTSRRHVDRAVLRKIIDLRRRGVPMEEVEKHADELRSGAAKEALEGLKLSFLMDSLGELFDITVTEEEVNTRIAEIARRYNRRFDRVRDELAAGDGLNALYLDLRDEKCLERLLSDAVIEESKGPAESVTDMVEST